MKIGGYSWNRGSEWSWTIRTPSVEHMEEEGLLYAFPITLFGLLAGVLFWSRWRQQREDKTLLFCWVVSLIAFQQVQDGLIAQGDPSLAVHPVQLYTAVALLVLAGVCYAVSRNKSVFEGQAGLIG